MHTYSDISSKWMKAKHGAWMMDTVSNNDGRLPELFMFIGIVTREPPKDWKGRWNTAGIKFQNVRTGEVRVEDADDRYGHYPILTQAVVDKMSCRLESLKEEVGKYEYILDLIDIYANADLRI